MKIIDFNEDLCFLKMDSSEEEKIVTLPHDAMLYENRTLESKGVHNIGWFEGHDYIYRKLYNVPEKLKNSWHILEFEGIYHNAEIYVNGNKAAFRPYGYTQILADITSFLLFDEPNDIKVIARNSDQPNSRWKSTA